MHFFSGQHGSIPFSVVHDGTEKEAVAAVCGALGVESLPAGTSVAFVHSKAQCCDPHAVTVDEFAASRTKQLVVEAPVKPVVDQAKFVAEPPPAQLANELSKIGETDQPAAPEPEKTPPYKGKRK